MKLGYSKLTGNFNAASNAPNEALDVCSATKVV
jgi:hypothetical protein